MKLSRRGKRTKCAKRTKRFKLKRNTKKQFRQYKRKNTYRKHSHKLRKNKRVMRGGGGENDFILDANSSTTGKPVYNSTCLLTYRRDKAFTNKTKDFTMTLSYDDAATTTEKKKYELYDEYQKFKILSPTGGDDGVYDSHLQTLNRINPLTSNNVERKLCAVFKLEMTSTDEKKTKFVVYFKLYTAIAVTRNGEYLKAFVTYALDKEFPSTLPQPIIETEFMKIDHTSPLLTVFPLFNNAVPLVIPDQSSTTDSDKNCTFSLKDNYDFFSRLTRTMVKYAADIKFAEQEKNARINEYEKNVRRNDLYPSVFPPPQQLTV
jgi:hypothetical protein